MSFRIRGARPEDAELLLAIYAPYVLETTVSFELSVPSVGEFAARIEQARSERVWLVLEEGGEVEGWSPIGYAYCGEFSHREAYQWSGEISIYLAQDKTGHGLGGTLLDALEAVMVEMGLVNSEACIADDNAGSIAFHKRHGYARRGEFFRCAHKHGRWLGIVWLEKEIAAHPDSPEPPAVLTESDLAAILAPFNELLKTR